MKCHACSAVATGAVDAYANGQRVARVLHCPKHSNIKPVLVTSFAYRALDERPDAGDDSQA